ncbi:hypothetical protein J5N97_006646 [Dioscorea zingiberensis]|uniref:Uncharacterized protein n=1 Tax=Dioscorea zingiberensis TaxID=325984 RepID=A0A9D5HSX4_9LILI|nr:hypothetical protein J5N97_006646 [Dioscorea zingiberensis]
MGKPRFLAILLISALLCLSFSQGYGRRVRIMKHFQKGLFSPPLFKGKWKVGRVMVEMEDYREPGANTNPRSGSFFTPPNDPNIGH